MGRASEVLLLALGLTALGCGGTSDRSAEQSEAAGSSSGSSNAVSDSSFMVTGLHHAHLNTVDVAAALAWYESVWPEGSPGEIAGHAAFLAEMPLLFNEVPAPPPGGFREDLGRSDPQSALWHIGAFINTTGLFETLERRGTRVLRLYTRPDDAPHVLRSGLAPYAGIVTATGLDTVEASGPRDGGFGYLLGPDGVLFELTGGPTTTPSFSHVHIFHEQPRCAANWYVDALGMTLPPRRDDAGNLAPHARWEGCGDGELGDAGWPSLESAGTLRSPNARVLYEGGSFSFYPRQCQGGRCGTDQRLMSSRGQVIDHVAFSVPSLAGWRAHLESLGVQVLEGPYRFGTGQAMMVEGPDGLLIELVEGS